MYEETEYTKTTTGKNGFAALNPLPSLTQTHLVRSKLKSVADCPVMDYTSNCWESLNELRYKYWQK